MPRLRLEKACLFWSDPCDVHMCVVVARRKGYVGCVVAVVCSFVWHTAWAAASPSKPRVPVHCVMRACVSRTRRPPASCCPAAHAPHYTQTCMAHTGRWLRPTCGTSVGSQGQLVGTHTHTHNPSHAPLSRLPFTPRSVSHDPAYTPTPTHTRTTGFCVALRRGLHL